MRSKFFLAGGISLLLPLCAAFAAPVIPVNQLVVFGDSLSDSGNASIATVGTEPGSGGYYYRNVNGVPFPVGEFTNAPSSGGPTGVWVDQLAPQLGVTVPQPFLTGGTNYAVATALTTGGIPGSSVANQLGYFAAANPTGAPAGALYTIWAGANDIAIGGNPVAAADSLYQDILTLSKSGAQYFLWPNLPDLGKVPGQLGSATAPLATAAALAFNGEWAIDLGKLQGQNLFVVPIDVYGLFNTILADPGSYGFSNTTGEAMQDPTADPNGFVFFDSEHPTAAADALIASTALADFNAALDASSSSSAPEPTEWALASVGLAAIGLVARKRRAKTNA